MRFAAGISTALVVIRLSGYSRADDRLSLRLPYKSKDNHNGRWQRSINITFLSLE